MLLPSILQSTSSGLSVKRMLLTLVPRLMTIDEPRTFKSLITVTESPSNSSAPLLSRGVSSFSVAVLFWPSNSYAQSGHTYNEPSKYTYSPPHFGHFEISLIFLKFWVNLVQMYNISSTLPKAQRYFIHHNTRTTREYPSRVVESKFNAVLNGYYRIQVLFVLIFVGFGVYW